MPLYTLPTQVSNDRIVGASGDYVARAKLAADTIHRVVLGLTTGDSGSLEFGTGAAARDIRFYRSSSKVLVLDDNAGGGVTIDLSRGQLYLPAAAGKTLTATEGYIGVDTTTHDTLEYDSQRQRVVGEVGWAPYALPFAYLESTIVSSAALAINGGSVAVPIRVTGQMLVQSISFWTGANASQFAEARLYREYLNNGNAGENTLTEVAGVNFASTALTASAINTINVTTPGTYIAPGTYWLVLRNTSASVVFTLGDFTVNTALARSRCQTKTLGSGLASTLDFVAATWTKQTYVVVARLDGRVFGQTAAF